MNPTDVYRSGFIALIGAPNTGKSTLLNRILGQKISITSPKPQTTRNRILGVHHFPGGQMIFLDTPGIHHARSKLNQRMVRTARSTLNEVNLVLWLVDAARGWGPPEDLILEWVADSKKPVFLLLNKQDLVSSDRLATLETEATARHSFEQVLRISALRGDGVPTLLERLAKRLPPGPPYFPPDMITDLPERFLAAEIIREKILLSCSQEVPYAVAVTVESFKEKKEEEMVVISAVIHVERMSQKGILIGRQGRMLKRIGEAARKELEALLGIRVYLELWVRVQKDWRKKDRLLDEFGYS